MIDLSVRGLVKGFEQGNDILKGITFDVNAGERVGILGRNGCGKTTFFRILSGELQPDAGTVSIAVGRRLGLISQIPVYPDGWTTEDVLREAHRRLYDMEARMNELTARMASDNSPALLAEYDRLSENFRRLGGYDMEHERNRVANGLDIPAAMRAQPFDSLSGGEKTRVNLARLILEDTDILLLDEPTNHLDLRATEWLEAYLLHFRGTVLVISHDRYFLDRVVQRSIDFTSGEAEFYSGNYSFYVVERQRRFDEQLKKYEKDQAKLQQLTEAAAKLHLWAFMGNDKLHKRAFSIEKRMEKLETTARPTEARKLNVHFTAQEFRGDDVLTMAGLGKRYGARTLFHDLDLTVTGGERIALIGDNGAGKTTFLRLVMNEETPDTGWVQRGPSVRTAYLPQIVRFAVPERSMLDTMLYECKCTPQEARDQLAAYGFCGEDVLKPVSALSGGELLAAAAVYAHAPGDQLPHPRRADQPPRHRQPRVDRGRAERLHTGAAVRIARPVLHREVCHPHLAARKRHDHGLPRHIRGVSRLPRAPDRPAADGQGRRAQKGAEAEAETRPEHRASA